MFSGNYFEAREKFKALALQSGFEYQSFPMTEEFGKENTNLSTDIAFHITPATKKLLIINSGIHGVEGFYGSAMQCQWLSENSAHHLPHDVGLVMIHACNPHGFANLERVDTSIVEEGVKHRIDPNRNFVDFDDLPENPRYAEVHDLLIPKDWFGEKDKLEYKVSTAKLFYRLGKDKVCNSRENFYIPIMKGQYEFPEGFSFGGVKPTWTNIVINKILAMDKIVHDSIEEMVFIDLHTGIGAKGTIEAYSFSGNPDNHANTLRFLQGTVNTIEEPYPVCGAVAKHVLTAFPNKKVTSFALECGTEKVYRVFRALRAANWLGMYGDEEAPYAKPIHEEVKHAFNPPEKEWQEQVTALSMQIFTAVLAKLSENVYQAKVAQDPSSLHKAKESAEQKFQFHLFKLENAAENLTLDRTLDGLERTFR